MREVLRLGLFDVERDDTAVEEGEGELVYMTPLAATEEETLGERALDEGEALLDGEVLLLMLALALPEFESDTDGETGLALTVIDRDELDVCVAPLEGELPLLALALAELDADAEPLADKGLGEIEGESEDVRELAALALVLHVAETVGVRETGLALVESEGDGEAMLKIVTDAEPATATRPPSALIATVEPKAQSEPSERRCDVRATESSTYTKPGVGGGGF